MSFEETADEYVNRITKENEQLKLENRILRERAKTLEIENQGYWEKTKALCDNIKILGGKLGISELNAKLRGENLAAAQKKIAELLISNKYE
jgi:hypothetical protein